VLKNTLLISWISWIGLAGCASDDDLQPTNVVEDLTADECTKLNTDSPPFSGPGCPKPAKMNDRQKQAQCRAVKKVALKKSTNTDCSDGWVFGPEDMQRTCIGAATDKHICMLDAEDPGPDHEAWPKGDGYSSCMQDWIVFCTDNFPAEMGITKTGEVCFLPGIDFGRLPVTSATGREVCQRMKGGELPGKCTDELCKPKPKPMPMRARPVRKQKQVSCTTTSPSTAGLAFAGADATSTCTETWVEGACVPDGIDCVETCEACAVGDSDPSCEDEDVCLAALATVSL